MLSFIALVDQIKIPVGLEVVLSSVLGIAHAHKCRIAGNDVFHVYNSANGDTRLNRILKNPELGKPESPGISP